MDSNNIYAKCVVFAFASSMLYCYVDVYTLFIMRGVYPDPKDEYCKEKEQGMFTITCRLSNHRLPNLCCCWYCFVLPLFIVAACGKAVS